LSDFHQLPEDQKPQVAFDLYVEYGGYRQAAEAMGIPKSCLHRYATRFHGYQPLQPGRGGHNRAPKNPVEEVQRVTGPETPGVTINPDQAVITGPKSTDAVTPRDLQLQHGFEPDDWDITHVKINQWGPGEGEAYHQLKITMKPRLAALIKPALGDRVAGWRPRKRRAVRGNPEAVKVMVVMGDFHAPLVEEKLFDAGLEILHELQPDEIIANGDTGDNAPFGKHRPNLRDDFKDITAQDNVDATYECLAGLRDAAQDARIIKTHGNHDDWMYLRVLETLPQMARLTRAKDRQEILDIGYILRLDELDIELVSHKGGNYFESEYAITDDLVVIHGVKTGKHGGAVKEIQTWSGASVIQNHDHKQALIRHVKRRPNNTEVAFWSWSVGAMCMRNLGYAQSRDVHQGFGVLSLWPDGLWHPEFVSFDPQSGVTTFRDRRYS
jgi:hypothetical protein